MEFVRVSRDVWGQEVLQGISWDLLPYAVGLGVVVIVGHAIFRLVRGGRRR